MGFGDFTQPRVRADGSLAVSQSSNPLRRRQFFANLPPRGHRHLRRGARAESSTCSITASSSSSSSSSATWILVEMPRGSGAGVGALPHAHEHRRSRSRPVSFPCRSLSTRWNTALSRSRSRHAGDGSLRFASSTAFLTVARMRSSSAATNRLTHRSGSSSHAPPNPRSTAPTRRDRGPTPGRARRCARAAGAARWP